VLSKRRSPPRAIETVQVTADFGHRRVTSGSMLGFLHGLDEATPQARWIAPLHPALW
jgi:hypothetical protein